MGDEAQNLQWDINAPVEQMNTRPALQVPQRTIGEATSLSATAKFSASYLFSKRLIDVLLASAFGLVMLPVMLLIALSLRSEAHAVVVAYQRIGRHGKEFKAYKFRTMMPNADRLLRDWQLSDPEEYRVWEQNPDLESDPRLTGLGRLLRRTRLDHLPMLWNVLKGDMSAVGPRPIVREELRKYGTAARYYLAQRPGLTGLWQVTCKSNRDFRSRIAVDRRYTMTASLWLDALVLIKAVGLVFRSR